MEIRKWSVPHHSVAVGKSGENADATFFVCVKVASSAPERQKDVPETPPNTPPLEPPPVGKQPAASLEALALFIRAVLRSGLAQDMKRRAYGGRKILGCRF